MVFDMSNGKNKGKKSVAKKRPQWGESKMKQAEE
jgi:hypothetical protein